MVEFEMEEDRGTYSVRVYADDARAKIGSACVGDALLACADGRCQSALRLSMSYCACDKAERNSSLPCAEVDYRPSALQLLMVLIPLP